MDKKVVYVSLMISFGIIIAILSMPEIMENLASNILNQFGIGLIFLALLFIGFIHGIKPDEHTWPITIPYALVQKNLKRAVLASFVFTGALTLVWTILSLVISQILSLLTNPEMLTPYADVIAGLTMIGVALLFILKTKKNENKIGTDHLVPDYRYIWIHGLAASFGGDFFVVLILSSVLIGSAIPASLGFSIGFLFGVGSMIAQSIVVIAAYKGFNLLIKNANLMAKSGMLSLLFLGIFLFSLGIINFINLII